MNSWFSLQIGNFIFIVIELPVIALGTPNVSPLIIVVTVLFTLLTFFLLFRSIESCWILWLIGLGWGLSCRFCPVTSIALHGLIVLSCFVFFVALIVVTTIALLIVITFLFFVCLYSAHRFLMCSLTRKQVGKCADHVIIRNQFGKFLLDLICSDIILRLETHQKLWKERTSMVRTIYERLNVCFFLCKWEWITCQIDLPPSWGPLLCDRHQLTLPK